MPRPRFSLQDSEPPALREGLAGLRTKLGIPTQFPAPVLAEAELAARSRLPELRDLRAIEFVTLDPASSTDLDQAFHLARTAEGYLLHYAIADVASFVPAGGAIDLETQQRGETLYAPTSKTPLHPPALSEGAASLLPEVDRPALVWELEFDSAGETCKAQVGRGIVRSRAKLGYVAAQAALVAGNGGEQLELLRELGKLREAVEAARGGVSLAVPEQQVVALPDRWELDFRATLPVEKWNAQLSLATGMAAAQLMLNAGIGILRTLPPAQQQALTRLRRTAGALGISWPSDMTYPEFVRSLDAAIPAQAAMLNACTTLFRGASYEVFTGAPPQQPEHTAIGAPYAHTTAPLRRLVDRYSGEICVAICAGTEIPAWVLEALPRLPGIMTESSRRAHKYERGVVDLVEAMVLAPELGRSFRGTVLDVEPKSNRGVVQLVEPAVQAPISGSQLVLGAQVEATLVAADLLSGEVKFQLLPS